MIDSHGLPVLVTSITSNSDTCKKLRMVFGFVEGSVYGEQILDSHGLNPAAIPHIHNLNLIDTCKKF